MTNGGLLAPGSRCRWAGILGHFFAGLRVLIRARRVRYVISRDDDGDIPLDRTGGVAPGTHDISPIAPHPCRFGNRQAESVTAAGAVILDLHRRDAGVHLGISGRPTVVNGKDDSCQKRHNCGSQLHVAASPDHQPANARCAGSIVILKFISAMRMRHEGFLLTGPIDRIARSTAPKRRISRVGPSHPRSCVRQELGGGGGGSCVAPGGDVPAGRCGLSNSCGNVSIRPHVPRASLPPYCGRWS